MEMTVLFSLSVHTDGSTCNPSKENIRQTVLVGTRVLQGLGQELSPQKYSGLLSNLRND